MDAYSAQYAKDLAGLSISYPKETAERMARGWLDSQLLRNRHVLFYHQDGDVVKRSLPGDTGYTIPPCGYDLDGALIRQPLGLWVYVPVGAPVDIQLRPRSSALAKHQVICPVGTIDTSYRGELIGMGLANRLLPASVSLFQLVLTPGWSLVYSELRFNETERGSGGFGSTDSLLTNT